MGSPVLVWTYPRAGRIQLLKLRRNIFVLRLRPVTATRPSRDRGEISRERSCVDTSAREPEMSSEVRRRPALICGYRGQSWAQNWAWRFNAISSEFLSFSRALDLILGINLWDKVATAVLMHPRHCCVEFTVTTETQRGLKLRTYWDLIFEDEIYEILSLGVWQCFVMDWWHCPRMRFSVRAGGVAPLPLKQMIGPIPVGSNQYIQSDQYMHTHGLDC